MEGIPKASTLPALGGGDFAFSPVTWTSRPSGAGGGDVRLVRSDAISCGRAGGRGIGMSRPLIVFGLSTPSLVGLPLRWGWIAGVIGTVGGRGCDDGVGEVKSSRFEEVELLAEGLAPAEEAEEMVRDGVG